MATGSNSIITYRALSSGATARSVSTPKRARSTQMPLGAAKNSAGGKIGGPGFCFPVWRWNGKQYVHHGQAAQEPGGCDQRP